MKQKVFVVDDDPALIKLLTQSLESSGYLVETVSDGKKAIRSLTEKKPDLVILDWNLPELSGLEICRFLRTHPPTARVPILMLTAFSETRQKASAFDTGADDYLTKPFDVQELIMRVRALLRRGGSDDKYSELLECGSIRMDVSAHAVTVDGESVELRPKEFELLQVMLGTAGRVISRKLLMERVWGISQDITTRTVDSHIARLREKLGKKASSLIVTVPGFGYKLESK